MSLIAFALWAIPTSAYTWILTPISIKIIMILVWSMWSMSQSKIMMEIGCCFIQTLCSFPEFSPFTDIQTYKTYLCG